MGENNKILDVTYGNFSCRLEGFDDSVETMKSVVGYFQDLSGDAMFRDDPTAIPDVDAIARLAAQQSGSAVSIERDDNGIHLKVMADEQDETPALTQDSTPALAHHQNEEGSDDASQDEFYEDQEDEGDTIDAFAPQDFDVTADDAAAADVGASSDDEDAPDETVLAPQARFAAPSSVEESDTSVADKLLRIRAVVGRGAPPKLDNSYAGDLADADETARQRTVNPLAQRLAELAKRNSDVAEPDDAEEEVAAIKSVPLTLLPEERVGFEADTEVDVADEDDAMDLGAPDDMTDEHHDNMHEDHDEIADQGDDADVDEATDADADADDGHDSAMDDNDLDEEHAVQADHSASHDTDNEDPTHDVTADVSVDAIAEQETTSHDEDDATDGQQPEDTPAPRAERIEAPLLLTTRHQPVTDDDDDDDDFDLHEEVAKIERELASRPGNELARHGLPRTVEDAMSRILMKTDLELDMQETRDGRDAFAQLKAAVAATEAARQLGDTGAKSRDVSAMFRDDYGAIEGGENSGGSALPPLKLVEPVGEPPLEPRLTASETAAGARLREIADITKANSTETAPLTFADFAREQGATDLVDKLEAAAAYIAFIEGESDFSRPQVMRVVQTASDVEVSREDGLRCFGRLLRQARVIKLNNGRFQIADNTRFRPTGSQAARG